MVLRCERKKRPKMRCRPPHGGTPRAPRAARPNRQHTTLEAAPCHSAKTRRDPHFLWMQRSVVMSLRTTFLHSVPLAPCSMDCRKQCRAQLRIPNNTCPGTARHSLSRRASYARGPWMAPAMAALRRSGAAPSATAPAGRAANHRVGHGATGRISSRLRPSLRRWNAVLTPPPPRLCSVRIGGGGASARQGPGRFPVVCVRLPGHCEPHPLLHSRLLRERASRSWNRCGCRSRLRGILPFDTGHKRILRVMFLRPLALLLATNLGRGLRRRRPRRRPAEDGRAGEPEADPGGDSAVEVQAARLQLPFFEGFRRR
mmetsp:Transcript_42285/g.122721  ORF Transcript_42285/g.122721 Transcript_42285/m.122721 type:complete len:314 (+) Transcript_42285:3-944(+)